MERKSPLNGGGGRKRYLGETAVFFHMQYARGVALVSRFLSHIHGAFPPLSARPRAAKNCPSFTRGTYVQAVARQIKTPREPEKEASRASLAAHSSADNEDTS